MKKIIPTLFIVLVMQSCIPLRIAPTIEDYMVTEGKKFEKGLSKRQMFVFEDTKDEAHFYNYIDIKFNLNNVNVNDDVPFIVNDIQYYFSFYEVERIDKIVNIITPLLITAASQMLYFDNNDLKINRKGNWYIAIEVYNDIEKDCLAKNSLSRTPILKYLREVKKEYLSTYNYNESLFTN